jgi:hypothetical protein
MTTDVLRAALALAARGWPVFPCHPGRKNPVTAHGHLDASTDPGQVRDWFGRHLDWNLAVATGAPGPDVLDVDQHGPAGHGYDALARLREAGLLDGATAIIATPSGGMHLYFTGTAQRCGHLPPHHLDFRSAGGYVLVPPSRIATRAYRRIATIAPHGHLDWPQAVALLEPARQAQRPAPPHPTAQGASRLASWVAAQPPGNRNAGLYWAANRVLDADPAADLSPLAAAARHAGLGQDEITRTLLSARRTPRARPRTPDAHPQGEPT